MDEPYRLPPGQRSRAADRIIKNEGFVPGIYLDTHKPPVPTIGYGTSLTDPDGKLWPDWKDRLRANGQDPDEVGTIGPNWGMTIGDQIEKAITEKTNPTGIEVTVDRDKARKTLEAAAGSRAETIRNMLGRDAAGRYNWDKLKEDQQNALLDADYNSPSFIGPNLVNALQRQEDPNWRDKAWYELAVNVKDPNRRRRDEGNAFKNFDPPQNLFSSDSFLESPGGNLFNSDADSKRVLDELQRRLEEGDQAWASRPSVG
jgi:hypothetical protein